MVLVGVFVVHPGRHLTKEIGSVSQASQKVEDLLPGLSQSLAEKGHQIKATKKSL
jgi:predicted phage tail protein